MELYIFDIVTVSDPKHEESTHEKEFVGRVMNFNDDGTLEVHDEDNNVFIVFEDEIISIG